MAYQIIYKRFLQKLFKLLDYLRSEWGDVVTDKFIQELRARLTTLSERPYIGAPSTSVKYVRSILITRQNRMFYRIKGEVIEVINM